MKNILFFMLIVFTYQISAQEQTLLSGQITHGGFGGPEVKFTQISDEFGVLVGGKGGWIVNHIFSIGAGGYGLVTQSPLVINNEERYLNFGYGGLILEYVHDWDKLLHYTFTALIGGGGIGHRSRIDHTVSDRSETKAFFILEPGANAEVNMSSFFRVNLGVSYRLLSAVEMGRFNEQNLSGFSANLIFKFGKF
jgi:hypothetical protein